MANIDINAPIDDDSAAYVKHYTESAQEQAVETPETVDKTPATDAERDALLDRSSDSFQSEFDSGFEVRERAEQFTLPGQWVHPKLRQQRQQAMMLPSVKTLDDLDGRLSSWTAIDGMPEDLASLASQARLAIGAAREAYGAAQHPDNGRFATSQDAKDRVQVKIGEAVSAVGAFERLAEEPLTQQIWFDSLTDGLDKKREATLKAIRAAEKAYADLRRTIETADLMAQVAGKYDKEWHHGVVEKADLNAPLEAMRTARGFLEGEDDSANGRFLTASYEGIPPHAMARLKRSAERTGGGSFAAQVYFRALRPDARDEAARQAIKEKRLILLLNSNPFAANEVKEKAERSGYGQGNGVILLED